MDGRSGMFEAERQLRRIVGYANSRQALTGKDRSGCRGVLCERDGVAEAFELFDEALGLAFGVALREEVGAEVAVGLAGREHVPDRRQQRVLDRAERALVAAPRLEALVLRGGVVGLD